MKLSIITVTYNNALGLERTIKSVACQTCKDFEYIVVDGTSTDKSLEIIKNNDICISKWVSEPDTGIYNAMNKAVRMATGDYCLFMNAGDALYSENTVEEIYSIDFNEEFVEGIEYHEGRNVFSSPKNDITLFYYYANGNNRHQASLIKRSMLLQYPYDESLRIASDLKFNIESIILRNCSYKTKDIIIAKFDGNGISHTVNHNLEKAKIYSELFPSKVIDDYKELLFLYSFPIKYFLPILKFIGKLNNLKHLIKK